MRAAVALALLAACGDNAAITTCSDAGAHATCGPDAVVGLARVTAYGRTQCGTSSGVLASGVEIRSYDATVDADHGNNTFATATTDANGVAMIRVPAGGYIVYEACASHVLPRWLESIQGIEPGDDVIVGDPTPNPPACSGPDVGNMTVAFPTIANASSYEVNGFTSGSPSVAIQGCDGTPYTILGQAFDSTGQSLGYQSQTVTFIDQSTAQLGPLMPFAVLDLTMNAALPYPPLFTEQAAFVTWQHVGSWTGGSYRFVYPRIAGACTIQWDLADLALATDENSVNVDLGELSQEPRVATRTIGETGSIYDDLQPDVEYLVDTPAGTQPLLSFLPSDPTAPSDPHRYTAYTRYAINDAQYDDYDDFRNQRRHFERPVRRSAMPIDAAGHSFSCPGDALQCWPTSR